MPWRRTHIVAEEEPIAVAPRHCRGSGGRQDADALGRQALGELHQWRPLESPSRRTATTLGELKQQLVVGELQQQRPFETLPARHCFSEREKNEGRREIKRDIYSAT
jgi:hypothetical protein